MQKPKCICEEFCLEKYDKMYIRKSLDYVSEIADGVAFIEVPILFCPKCGKKLEEDK